MVKRFFAGTILGILLLTGLGACHTMGKKTGEAVNEVEEGAKDFKKGYEEGRSE